MKRTIRLTESELRGMIKSVVNETFLTKSLLEPDLTTSNDPLKKPFYNLMNAIDDFVEAVEKEPELGSERTQETKELFDMLRKTRYCCERFVQHYEDHTFKRWETIPWY